MDYITQETKMVLGNAEKTILEMVKDRARENRCPLFAAPDGENPWRWGGVVPKSYTRQTGDGRRMAQISLNGARPSAEVISGTVECGGETWQGDFLILWPRRRVSRAREVSPLAGPEKLPWSLVSPDDGMKWLRLRGIGAGATPQLLMAMLSIGKGAAEVVKMILTAYIKGDKEKGDTLRAEYSYLVDCRGPQADTVADAGSLDAGSLDAGSLEMGDWV